MINEPRRQALAFHKRHITELNTKMQAPRNRTRHTGNSLAANNGPDRIDLLLTPKRNRLIDEGRHPDHSPSVFANHSSYADHFLATLSYQTKLSWFKGHSMGNMA